MVKANDSFYTPAAPLGPSSGFLDVEYEYTVFTTNSSTSWLFDWGDGTLNRWIQLTDGNSSIIQSHQWTSAGVYQVRVKFKNEFFINGVWSDILPVTINIAYSDDYPKTPLINSATIQGTTGQTYYYAVLGTDPQNDNVQYRFNWGDETLSNWTSFVTSGSCSVVSHGWQKPGNYSITAQSRDHNRLESSWSQALNITITSDVLNDLTSLDILLLNGVYHRIESAPGQEKIFTNTTSGISSVLQSNTIGTYLLDDTGDGTWNYVYTPSTGSIERYQQPPETPRATVQIPWLFILIIGVVVGIILTFAILIKSGYLYIYEEAAVDK